MRSGELILVLGAVCSLSLVAYAGGIIEWNSEKTSGIWSDGANWIGNVAPIAEEDIVVKGKGTCSLTQDGSSICMTVKPTAGGLIVIVQ